MGATWFANTWHYHPPQYRVGLEVNHNILSSKVVLTETATSLAKEQYTIYSKGTPKSNSLFGIRRQLPKQEISFKANQSHLP